MERTCPTGLLPNTYEAPVCQEAHVSRAPGRIGSRERPEDDYLPNVWKKSVYPLAHRLGVPLSLPSISPQPYTRLAHEGFQFAKKAGKALEYNARVFHAFFQEDRDIGDLAELTKLAGEIGLDGSSFRAALESGEFTKRHKQSLKKAMEFGVNSVPSVFIDGKALQGVYDPKALRSLLVNIEAGEVARSKSI